VRHRWEKKPTNYVALVYFAAALLATAYGIGS
jgi:hypothetical protein